MVVEHKKWYKRFVFLVKLQDFWPLILSLIKYGFNEIMILCILYSFILKKNLTWLIKMLKSVNKEKVYLVTNIFFRI